MSGVFDFWDRFDDISRISEIGLFQDYLESVESFLEAEFQKHTERLRNIDQKLRSGELSAPPDPGQLPGEMEYDKYRLEAIERFTNILRKSFFVSLYTFLESSLIQRCHRRRTGEPETSLSLSDIAGKGIFQAMTYLIKVRRINFSLETNPEWNEIRNYNRLRNCIVHNEGYLNEGAEPYDKLARYVSTRTTLSLSGDEIVLSKGFCEEAPNTIERFLESVLLASALQ